MIGSTDSAAVIGLGKLGSCVLATFAYNGIRTVGYDLDATKVSELAMGRPPVAETGLEAFLQRDSVKRHTRFTTNIEDVVRLASTYLFVVPTPSRGDWSFDSSFLMNAMTSVAMEVRAQQKSNYLFIVNSTLSPGTCNQQVVPMLASILGENNVHLAYKPEFIALGTVLRNLVNPDFMLVGTAREDDARAVERLYGHIIHGHIAFKHMSLVEAELCKISLNCAITMKISYANQVAEVARKYSADPVTILDAVGSDRRIGHACLVPGLPYGGPCFPRDNRMFMRAAYSLGVEAELARASDFINRHLLEEAMDVIVAGPVGILGQAYKPGTPLTDESPGRIWAERLRARGIEVRTHDPMAPCTHSMADVVACSTIVVATLWPEYRKLALPASAVVVDPAGFLRENERITCQEAL